MAFFYNIGINGVLAMFGCCDIVKNRRMKRRESRIKRGNGDQKATILIRGARRGNLVFLCCGWIRFCIREVLSWCYRGRLRLLRFV
jgi:hypothetical protein